MEEQAKRFLEQTGTKFKAEFLKNEKHFEEDTETRDIYKITLTRGEREYKFNFGQSIAESGFKIININKEVKYTWFNECLTYVEQFKGEQREKEIKKFVFNKFGNMQGLKLVFGKIPSAYDVLACLTKYPVGTFKDFCSEFGYDLDSRKGEKTYKAVVKEYDNVKMLWSDSEIEVLGEIQ